MSILYQMGKIEIGQKLEISLLPDDLVTGVTIAFSHTLGTIAVEIL